MKILSIGSDSKLFEEDSSVLLRQKEYASKVDELHIVVFTNSGFKEKQMGNLYLYPTNSKIFSLFFGYIKARKALGDKKNFVITTQDPFEAGLLGVVVKAIHKLPLQIQIHTDFLSPYFRNTFLNTVRVFISKLVIPKADGIRVVSSVVKDSLVEKYPSTKDKIDVLPIWVDIDTFTKTSVVSEGIMYPYTILMASRLTKEKNILLAVEVFKRIIKVFPIEGLYIVGSGDQGEIINNEIKKSGLGERVKIVGWESQFVLSSLYKKAKVFLSTSDFEGYGMTLIEAGASGCPIVTTKVGLAKTDLFQDGINSYVCPVGDVECLAEKLTSLLNDENKRKLFSENMKESIQKVAINKEEYIDRYIGLLEKIKKQ